MPQGHISEDAKEELLEAAEEEKEKREARKLQEKREATKYGDKLNDE